LIGRLSTFRVLAMPRLSPTTESVKIREWYLREGDTFESYQLALRVETDSLLKDEGEITHELDIEIIEEGTVVKLLIDASDEKYIDVDTPIALVCDEDHFDKDKAGKVDLTQAPLALWQAYAIAKEDEPERCGTCG
jgi:pyruvate/2-oxoglutarate dehydrogenase complex dihydrolipoamide acyltransferase (E2) component